MNEIKIEKGIAPPEKKRHYLFSVFENMEIGDSFSCEFKDNYKVRGAIDRMKLYPNLKHIKIVSKMEENGYRFWRVE